MNGIKLVKEELLESHFNSFDGFEATGGSTKFNQAVEPSVEVDFDNKLAVIHTNASLTGLANNDSEKEMFTASVKYKFYFDLKGSALPDDPNATKEVSSFISNFVNSQSVLLSYIHVDKLRQILLNTRFSHVNVPYYDREPESEEGRKA